MLDTKRRGFTLVEILVVVAILSILASVITVYGLASSESSRNAKRQADLRALQAAVEQYKLENGHYPEGCRGADNWSGEKGMAFKCSGTEDYIKGLAPKYIRRLPKDPRLGDCPAANSNECGYAYVTNAAGTVYKIIAMNTVEGEEVTTDHPMKPCDVLGAADHAGTDILLYGMCKTLCDSDIDCNPLYNTNGKNNPGNVTTDITNHTCNALGSVFQHSYAVWGGFAPLRATLSNPSFKLGDRYVDETAVDPLQSFFSINGSGNVVYNVNNGQKLQLRIRALYDTTAIICK